MQALSLQYTRNILEHSGKFWNNYFRFFLKQQKKITCLNILKVKLAKLYRTPEKKMFFFPITIGPDHLEQRDKPVKAFD